MEYSSINKSVNINFYSYFVEYQCFDYDYLDNYLGHKLQHKSIDKSIDNDYLDNYLEYFL